MPAAPPAPNRTNRSARPRAGSGPGSTAAPHRRQLGPDGPGPVPRPPPETAQALGEGELSAAHAAVVAHGTQDLPEHVRAEADPVLVEAARRLDPPQLRRVTGHLRLVTDPDNADAQAQRRHQRRGLWLTQPSTS
jgi:hypothetical protein